MTADPPAGRRRRRATAVAAPVVAAGVAAGIVLSVPNWRPGHPAAQPAVAVGYAPVVRADLTNTVQVSGSIAYAGSYTIVNTRPGTAYTALPALGEVIRRGQELYEVDGTPSLGCDGKYVTSPEMVQSEVACLEVMNFLIDKSRAEHKK